MFVRLTSSAFENNQQIPEKYTCEGENISPPLSVSEVPEAALSLVLIVEDPDAPAKNFTHWVVFNIPASIAEINENQVPIKSVVGYNDFGKIGYAGPCPPSGTHRYTFKLFALAVPTIDLPQGVTKAQVEEGMGNNVLDTALLTGLYEKKGAVK